MKHKLLIKLIDKYLADECSEQEARIVEKWYESHIQTQEEFLNEDKAALDNSAARSLQSIKNKLGLNSQPRSKADRRLSFTRPWVAAASIILLISAGLFIFFSNYQKQETYTYFKSAKGEVKHVILPDGTQVWLNAGTILKYASNYNQRNREVYLNGEAYFDVMHNQNKPFDIYSGTLKTSVLGTAFSVSSYPDIMISTVTVSRGKVQVGEGTKMLGSLLPNQQLEFDQHTRRGKISAADAEKVNSWKDGKLSFIDMPMQDIAVHLQKWYGVKFVFKNQQLKKTRFTASFINSIGLSELLAIMHDVSHVSYQFDAKNKIITY